MRASTLAVAALLLATSLLWVWHIVGMPEDGSMQSCLLAGGRIMLCALSAAGQIGLWHEMFAVILPLSAVFGLLTLALVRRHGAASTRHDLQRTYSNAPQWRSRMCREWIPLEPLRQALSQGILHPKIYDLDQS